MAVNKTKAKKSLERYTYKLVDKKVAACTDVTKFYDIIVRAIKTKAPNARSIQVVKNGYSYKSNKLTPTDLRMIGRAISRNCPELRDKARVYKAPSTSKNQTSRQIFIKAN